tara:strand:- start:394 stop:588 length:195 start_codon:yes stop_codon:yes gene_type:complete
MSDKKTRLYNGFYFVYENETVLMFENELSTSPLKKSDTVIKSDKDFEMEMMWMFEKYSKDTNLY